MQTATTLDPLTDIAPLLEMALAAEARLRPLIAAGPSDADVEADPVPHLNRVTLILGRMVQIRKALRALRDGGEPPRAPKQRPPRRATPILAEFDGDSTETRDSAALGESLAARIAGTHRLIDAIEPHARSHAVGRNLSPAPTKSNTFYAKPIDPDQAHGQNLSPAPLDSNAPCVEPHDIDHALDQNLPPASAETNPITAEPQPASFPPLFFPLNSPAQTQAIAKKLNRALDRLAAQARRLLPAAIPSSPFNLNDLAPAAARTNLSPALLKNLQSPPANTDTS